jgi:4-hydroxy-3-methylbut-2-enyl diphosphate reductase
LVHNKQVVQRLEVAGVKTVRDVADVDDDTVVIATHGAPAEVLEKARERGLRVIDATCPYVRVIQQKARRLSDSGFEVVLLGDRGHTEVQGIVGWARGVVHVVAGAAELGDVLPVEEKPRKTARKIAFLSQTTQSLAAFQELIVRAAHIYLKTTSEMSVHNTICDATALRQQAAMSLASRCDVVIVVGGRNSANTKRLVELCAQTGVRVYQIEVADGLNPLWFEGARVVGLTAGASTPDWIISEVQRSIEELK